VPSKVSPQPGSPKPVVGDRLELDTVNVAHGGYVVARQDGFVVFVRGALPDERVIAEVTDVKASHAFAETVEVLAPHPDRRVAPCPAFHAFGCGGCDFQHASYPLQLRMKTAVLREALSRHGRLPDDRVDELTAEGVLPLGPQTRWRSRMRFGVVRDGEGQMVPALRAHRSSRRVAADKCTIADSDVLTEAMRCARDAGDEDVIVVAKGDDGARAQVGGSVEGARVRHRLDVEGHPIDFQVPLEGFWQAEPRLVPALMDAVVEFGGVRPGQHWWDLYAGVGPLAAALGARVGARVADSDAVDGSDSLGSVQAVEGVASAVSAAKRALHAMPWVRLHEADVREWLARASVRGADHYPDGLSGVVLDPPRSGAGAEIVDAIVATQAPVIVYVACDPVALGRDAARLERHGYRLTRLRAWDAFAQSHHFETVAAFERQDRIS